MEENNRVKSELTRRITGKKRRRNSKENKIRFRKSMLTSVETFEGETIEMKVNRLIQNKEPIKDGAPIIYTERKEGVVQAYNIRADRWEIAAEAMDAVHASTAAKRDAKVIELNKSDDKNDGQNIGDKSTQGTGGSDSKAE